MEISSNCNNPVLFYHLSAAFNDIILIMESGTVILWQGGQSTSFSHSRFLWIGCEYFGIIILSLTPSLYNAFNKCIFLFWVGVIISSSNKSVSEYLFQMVLTTRTGAAVNFYCKFWKRFRFRFWVVIVETGTLKNPHLENTGLRLVFQQIINSAQTGFTKPKYELLEFSGSIWVLIVW